MSKKMLFALRKFSIIYHPDKNTGDGEDWHAIATKLSQLGNSLHGYYKGRVAATAAAGMD